MAKKKTEIHFDTAVKRLEEIVDELENNDVDLDKALKLYEEGIQLSRFCNNKLEDAERKIEILKNGGEIIKEVKETGEAKTTPEMELFDI